MNVLRKIEKIEKDTIFAGKKSHTSRTETYDVQGIVHIS